MPTAGSPSSRSDCLGWWTLVRDRHGVRPASCACWVTAPEAGPGERLAGRLGFGKWIVEGTSFRLPDEVRYIQRQAANHDGRIVTIGQLVLFSTDTGDAWLLDRSDQLAARLASRWRDRTDPYRGNRYCIHCQLEGPLSY